MEFRNSNVIKNRYAGSYAHSIKFIFQNKILNVVGRHFLFFENSTFRFLINMFLLKNVATLNLGRKPGTEYVQDTID